MKNKKQLKSQRARRDKRKQKSKGSLIVIPPDPSIDVPDVNMDLFLAAIARKDSAVWEAILTYFHFFETHHYLQLGVNAIKKINRFLHCLFTAYMREDFYPEGLYATKMVQCGHLIQHLTAISSYRTTDSFLDATLVMQNNGIKLMSLMNPRNEIQLKQSIMFDTNPYAASLWFIAYIMGISSPTERIQKNLYRHLACMDDRFSLPHHSISGVYFSCTYHCPEGVRRVKSIINKSIKSKLKGMPIENNPDPKSIAIVTERWHRNHAVYKSAGPLVEQLRDKYNLTLIWTNSPGSEPDTMVKDYFDKVDHCYFKENGELIIPDCLMKNNFQMLYYPDIGMSDESIWMSNIRFAPIQACGYGHPDTTGDGNEIDYFVGGNVENGADDFYSETCVRIPGLAQVPAWPTAQRQYNHNDDDIVRVNCVWGPDKYNFSLLKTLEAINNEVGDSKHEFHLFGSPGLNRYAALPPFIKEVKKLLPNAHIHSQWEYYDYMREAEKNDFSLNSFPFGCYNVLVESLWMGLPFLTLIGKRFYNRAGMWLNEQVGMDENNFDTPSELIKKAAKLINNPEELKRQRLHLSSIDLKDCLFTLKGNHFLEAIDYIIENHPFNETKLIGA